MSTFELTCVSGGLALLGVLLGSWTTYRFSQRLMYWNALREGRHRLLEAFQPELAALDPARKSKRLDVEKLLQDAWPRHRAAVSELLFYLPEKERSALEAAWRDYYLIDGTVAFHEYCFGEKPEETFQQRVAAILKFAHPEGF